MIKTTDDLFGRLVTAMVTPFNENLEIDFSAVERIVEHLIGTGSTAIVVCGTTGESPTLEEHEKQELLKSVVKFAGKRARVIMGAGSNDTRKSIKSCRQAEEDGADALLVVAPYYNKPNQEGLKAHFSSIARSTSLPLMLYNIPGRTGVNINPETVVELASEYSNIAALKDSTGNVEQAQEVGSRARPEFRIYSGDDNLTLPFLAAGACGVVSVASHIIGKELKEMIDDFYAGKHELARSKHYSYLPFFKALFLAPNPTCVKYALARMGICREELRLPLVSLCQAHRQAIDDLLQGIKPKSTSTRV